MYLKRKRDLVRGFEPVWFTESMKFVKRHIYKEDGRFWIQEGGKWIEVFRSIDDFYTRL